MHYIEYLILYTPVFYTKYFLYFVSVDNIRLTTLS